MLSFAGHNVVMKVKHSSKQDISTQIHFDVADSSALARLSISDTEFPTHRLVNVHISYKSNPEVTYLYGFTSVADIANLYVEVIRQDSAGKFATYVRDNANDVYKLHADGKGEFLPARKTLVDA